MKIIILLISSLLATAQPSMMKGDVWGKIIKVSKNNQLKQFSYYMTYQIDGKNHAYPISPNKEFPAEDLNKLKNKFARISGEIKEENLNIDGQKKIFYYFSPNKISPLSLAELSISPNNKYQQLPSKNKKDPYQPGGISIPDKIANGIIMTSGALLIGSILKKYLVK